MALCDTWRFDFFFIFPDRGSVRRAKARKQNKCFLKGGGIHTLATPLTSFDELLY
jgi:hypothetical protein